MMSGNRLGKLVFTTVLLASFTAMTPLTAYAERADGNSWWSPKKAQDTGGSPSSGVRDSIMAPSATSNISGSKAGQAVTKTEVFADKSVAPMVSINSAGAMANAVSRYEAIAAQGGWGTLSGKKLSKGDDGAAVVALKHRLIAEGYLGADALSGETAQWFTAGVEKALAEFQANNGLAVTGKTDKPTVSTLNIPVSQRLATMRANLPRLHEYSKGLADRYIIVNVPALQLEAVNFNTVFSRHNVIAGSPKRPTPVTITQVSDINFNPYWNVPVSIVERDLLPRIRRNGVSVFRDMDMRIYDGWNGPEVDPRTVDWDYVAANRYFFRQDPGEENSMASVKINFPSPFGIYLHDTPTKSLFTTGARYLSSGCVRVDQVSVLINWILNGQDGWNPQRIEAFKQSKERMDVKVTNAPQLRTVYLTSWVNGAGQVNFRPDVYDLDDTGFVVGQPLAPGELSDDGKRYVLKAQVYQVEEVPDQPESFSFFNSRRKPKVEKVSSSSNDQPFGFFNMRRKTTDSGTTSGLLSNTKAKPKKVVAADNEDDVLFNFNKPGSSKTKKAAAKKTPDKKKLQQASITGAGKKKPVVANSKAKKVEQAAAPAKKAAPAATTAPVIKKKKVEEATTGQPAP
ncbi:L,D-transpeptidase family protein [Nordella sp. HKS 07]|uniref:L,D-transpeptidase family protein n=1 Tax=Nordella sp. HKS 07 TaxID=2712222 RepID=UPI0013E20147|nr:L,D-transpeptidase family protein [Nordella sp. HKS 07]QIG50887.1 L,D-transpeptidase family protein [Nordella sp. HKS 07]